MEWSIQVSEQRLLQASVDLRNQMAEIHKLRTAIQLAEASKRCHDRSEKTARVAQTPNKAPESRNPPASTAGFRILAVGRD
jgi:hypothetical protein